ncbi:MAG: hypothetical protein ACJ79R_20555 [Anaeromyxobacteraceae bacterium]
MSEQSIYPIHQLYFRCDGCGAQWMLRAEPAIANIEEFKAFTSSPEKMEPCPKGCGARTCSVVFRAASPDAPPASGPHDPFEVFDREAKKQ